METWVTGRRQRLRVLGDSVPGKKNEYPRPLFGRRKGASVTKRWRGSETREEGLAPACKGGRTSAPVSALEMVMACQGRCYKAPQTRRLQTTESSSLTVPEAGRQESARQRARALHLFHAFLSPSGVAGNRWFVDASPPVSASVVTWPPSSCVSVALLQTHSQVLAVKTFLSSREARVNP